MTFSLYVAVSNRELEKLRAHSTRLTTENDKLQEENDSLRGQVHLLQFKIELLVDMLTLANLDCNKLELELEV